jgi:multidrug efflux pump subunit AcrA (membrane-fusion protein)
VTPTVSGQITEISVKANAPVKAGAVLFTIDPAPYDAQVRIIQQLGVQELRLSQMACHHVARPAQRRTVAALGAVGARLLVNVTDQLSLLGVSSMATRPIPVPAIRRSATAVASIFASTIRPFCSVQYA